MEESNEHQSPIFQLMVESAPNAILLVDGDDIITLANRQAEVLFGYSRTELTGNNIDILIPDRYKERHLRFTKAFIKNPSARTFGAGRELYALRKDGTEIPAEIALSLLPSPDSLIQVSVIDITERKRAEARFKALIEHNIDAIVMLDENGFVTYTSPATYNMMGYEPGEFLGRHGNIFFHPDEMDIVAYRMNEAMKNPGKAIYSQNRIRHKDGHYIWTEGTTTNLLNDKNVKAIVGNFREITDKRLADEKLERSEKRFKALIENNYEIITLRDKESNLIYISPGAEKTLGYRVEELSDIKFSDIFHPEDTEAVQNRFSESIHKPGIPIFGIQRMKHKDGHYIWLDGTITNFLDDENVKAVVGNFRDITDRKASEEKIQQNEKRFRALIEHNFDAISLYDEKGNILYQSPATERLIGYKLEERMGMSVRDYIHTDDLPKALERLDEARKNPGKPVYGINRKLHKDGHYIWTEGTTTNLLNDESVKAMVGNFRDITDRKTAEEKLIRANRIYALISNINKAIAHTDDELKLFNEACQIAVETGKFEMAFIARLDLATNNLKLIAHYNTIKADIEKFENYTFGKNGLIENLLKNGKHSFVNNYESTPYTTTTGEYILERGFKSSIALSIRKGGEIAYSLHIFSNQKNLFDSQELELLSEITDDLSFALDIFEKEKLRREAEEKTIKAKRLYAFISAINQTIVHVPDKQTLFEETCRIAVEIGKFEFAFIGNIDYKNKLLHLVAHRNGTDADLEMFQNFEYQTGGALDRVLKSDSYSYSYINDYEKAPAYHKPTQYALNRGFRSGIILPVWQSGNIVSTFNLLSTQANIFDEQELRLLEEISNDLSFALDTFEKERMRREAEAKKNQAMRLYAFISAINQAIVHENDKQELFDKTCRIAVEFGGFELALVCSLDEVNSTMCLIAHANASASEIEMFQNLTFESTGATYAVLKSGKCSYINDYEKVAKKNNVVQFALRRGFRSGIVLPLKQSGKIIASLSLMSGQPDLFDVQEIKLLEEIAEDISFALDVIEKERLRKYAEFKLRHNEFRLMQAQGIAHIGSWEMIIDNPFVIWSDEHCRIYGLDPIENKQTRNSWLSFIHPDDIEFVLKTVDEAKAGFKSMDFNHRIILRDGKIKNIHCQSYFETDSEGNPSSLVGISHDITEQKEAEDKIIHANRLYAFISQINQAIVRSIDQQTVFREVCRIAVEYGKFRAAWIGILDDSREILNLQDHCGLLGDDITLFTNYKYDRNGIQGIVINSGVSYVCNNIQEDPILANRYELTRKRSWLSCMVLPIKKAGEIGGTLNILSSDLNFFDNEEIRLLEEATNDISFALDIFEGDKLRIEFEKNLVHS